MRESAGQLTVRLCLSTGKASESATERESVKVGSLKFHGLFFSHDFCCCFPLRSFVFLEHALLGPLRRSVQLRDLTSPAEAVPATGKAIK